ncbi:putative photosynthetic complex assembly protein PuhE [Phaeobacter sp.]|uniref:putative photosynthetic complex assembly protein PuhE n=1 Tax=Phaeobacter sp. TaxID=1902409 RepID=UPI0025D7A482|nr:putative photosynthetic complex assembly protein PuhE [Phaeobacter sp.]
MIASAWFAAAVACALWWASTGLILRGIAVMDQRRDIAPGVVCVASLPLLGLGALLMSAAQALPTTTGDYAGFVGALAIWGWIEISFLTGVITGPRPFPCPAGISHWERFWRGFGTIAYHEAALVLGLVAVIYAHTDATNPTGLWVYALLFAARISAKLNLFLGVPHVHSDFLPRALAHMPSHFRRQRINALFPVSAALLGWVAIAFALRATASSDPRDGLIAALAGLALLEHVLLVLPLPDDKLWRWMLPAPKEEKSPKPFKEDANGI